VLPEAKPVKEAEYVLPDADIVNVWEPPPGLVSTRLADLTPLGSVMVAEKVTALPPLAASAGRRFVTVGPVVSAVDPPPPPPGRAIGSGDAAAAGPWISGSAGPRPVP
jgi:hypothetical protein